MKVRIDWTARAIALSQLGMLFNQNPRKYGAPPNKKERETATVLEQTVVLGGGWARQFWISKLLEASR